MLIKEQQAKKVLHMNLSSIHIFYSYAANNSFEKKAKTKNKTKQTKKREEVRRTDPLSQGEINQVDKNT